MSTEIHNIDSCINNDQNIIKEKNVIETRNVENFQVIWLDSSINEMNDDTKNSITHLR